MRKIVKKQIMHNAKDVLYRKEGNSRHIQKTEKPLSFFLINSFAHVFILMNKFTPSLD